MKKRTAEKFVCTCQDPANQLRIEAEFKRALDAGEVELEVKRVQDKGYRITLTGRHEKSVLRDMLKRATQCLK